MQSICSLKACTYNKCICILGTVGSCMTVAFSVCRLVGFSDCSHVNNGNM
jgi:hypothetical protein